MQTKRDTLIDTALALFAEHGFHATGVDRIRDATGISKVTLYKYFPDEIRHARVIMKAEALELVWKQAREGSSPMIRRAVELTSVPRDRGDFIREVSREAQEPKAEKIGKKEALKRAADNPDKSDALGALMAERMAAGDLN